MVSQDVIEEHPPIEPAPWVSNAVIAPKPDGTIRMTVDERNVNKTIQASNLPIPRQEDIKEKLSGAKIFSKISDGFQVCILANRASSKFKISYSIPRERHAVQVQATYNGSETSTRRA
jgi:hypothetical protein